MPGQFMLKTESNFMRNWNQNYDIQYITQSGYVGCVQEELALIAEVTGRVF